MQRILLLFVAFFISGCATPATVKSLQQWHNREVRLGIITRKIITANLSLCPIHRKYYGFTSIWLEKNANTDTGMKWAEAFHLQEEPTIITVIPNSAVDRAGLRVGDAILSFNNIQWPKSDADKEAYGKELRAALTSPTMRLVVRRNEKEISLFLTGEDACAADAALVNNQESNAHAGGYFVFIDDGLEELLRDDAELAFVVAHEVAHVILGHSAPGKKNDLNDKKLRASMEQAADALGIRLMVRAGYDPAAATTAIRKIDHANRGPISRWLGLHGAYMPTEQRVEFLKTSTTDIGE